MTTTESRSYSGTVVPTLFAGALLLAEYLCVALAFDVSRAKQLEGLRTLGVMAVIGGATTLLSLGLSKSKSVPRASHASAALARAHAALFALFCWLTWLVLHRAEPPPGPLAAWLVAWAAAGLASTLTLFAALLGPSLWSARAFGFGVFGALASGAGMLAGHWAQQGWEPLARATLLVAAALLEGVFSDVVVDAGSKTLGAQGFVVTVEPECSGFEGIGLSLMLMSGFLIVFRERLRFPRAWLLVPLAALAVWIGNSVRIALLVAVGASIDPELAVGAFHTKIGWILFSAISVAVAVAGHESTLFSRQQGAPVASVNPAVPLLGPGLVLMATALGTSAFAGVLDRWYALRILAAALVLFLCRKSYRTLDRYVSCAAPAVGLAVAVLWLCSAAPALAPRVPEATSVAWLVCRALGSVLLVPICEELMFRGYLLRRLQASDFTRVSARAWTPFAVVASSLVFGVLHDRWLAATCAGLAYAALSVRTGRLGEAVVAHAVTNACIAVWVLGSGDWSHWL